MDNLGVQGSTTNRLQGDRKWIQARGGQSQWCPEPGEAWQQPQVRGRISDITNPCSLWESCCRRREHWLGVWTVKKTTEKNSLGDSGASSGREGSLTQCFMTTIWSSWSTFRPALRSSQFLGGSGSGSLRSRSRLRFRTNWIGSGSTPGKRKAAPLHTLNFELWKC